jgi:hypothetical protein
VSYKSAGRAATRQGASGRRDPASPDRLTEIKSQLLDLKDNLEEDDQAHEALKTGH